MINQTLVQKIFKIHISLVPQAALLLVNPNRLQRTVLSGRGLTKSKVVKYGIILKSVKINLTLPDVLFVGPNISIQAKPQTLQRLFLYSIDTEYYALLLNYFHAASENKACEEWQACEEEKKEMELAIKRKSGASVDNTIQPTLAAVINRSSMYPSM